MSEEFTMLEQVKYADLLSPHKNRMWLSNTVDWGSYGYATLDAVNFPSVLTKTFLWTGYAGGTCSPTTDTQGGYEWRIDSGSTIMQNVLFNVYSDLEDYPDIPAVENYNWQSITVTAPCWCRMYCNGMTSPVPLSGGDKLVVSIEDIIVVKNGAGADIDFTPTCNVASVSGIVEPTTSFRLPSNVQEGTLIKNFTAAGTLKSGGAVSNIGMTVNVSTSSASTTNPIQIFFRKPHLYIQKQDSSTYEISDAPDDFIKIKTENVILMGDNVRVAADVHMHNFPNTGIDEDPSTFHVKYAISTSDDPAVAPDLVDWTDFPYVNNRSGEWSADARLYDMCEPDTYAYPVIYALAELYYMGIVLHDVKQIDIVEDTVPSTPSIASVEHKGVQCKLTWDYYSTNPDYFTIWRQMTTSWLMANMPYEFVGIVKGDVREFVDKNTVLYGHTYQYRVKAVTGSDSSAFSYPSVNAVYGSDTSICEFLNKPFYDVRATALSSRQIGVTYKVFSRTLIGASTTLAIYRRERLANGSWTDWTKCTPEYNSAQTVSWTNNTNKFYLDRGEKVYDGETVIDMRLKPDTEYQYRVTYGESYKNTYYVDTPIAKTHPEENSSRNGFLARLKQRQHPRLFITQPKIDFLKTRYQQGNDEVLNWIYDRVKERWEYYMDGKGDYFYEMHKNEVIFNGHHYEESYCSMFLCLGYLFTDSTVCAEQALKVAKYMMYKPGSTQLRDQDCFQANDILFHYIQRTISIVYDWLYNYMQSNPQHTQLLADMKTYLKKLVKSHVDLIGWESDIDLQVSPFNSLYAPFTRYWNRGSNWNHGMMFALADFYASAVLADEADCQELIENTIGSAILNTKQIIDTYSDDGGWEEGVGYSDHTYYALAQIMTILHNNFGTSLIDIMMHKNGVWGSRIHQSKDISYLANMGLWYMYTKTPVSPYMFDYGDTGWTCSPPAFASMAHNLYFPKSTNGVNNTIVAWDAYKYSKDNPNLLPSMINDMVYGLILYHPIPEAGKNYEVVPLSAKFTGERVNIAVIRDSWTSPDVAYLGVIAGRVGNHSHVDFGNYIFVSKNVKWTHDFGYPSGKASDYVHKFDHHKLYKSHNTLVVNDFEPEWTNYAYLGLDSKNDIIRVDLSRVYQIEIPHTIMRYFYFNKNTKEFTISENIDCGNLPLTFQSQFYTSATVELMHQNKTCKLTGIREDGAGEEIYYVHLASPSSAVWQTEQYIPTLPETNVNQFVKKPITRVYTNVNNADNLEIKYIWTQNILNPIGETYFQLFEETDNIDIQI